MTNELDVLIGEFMPKSGVFYLDPTNCITLCEAKDLEYGSSWSWLMPVVEYIESLHDASYRCRIVGCRCVIYDTHVADQSIVYFGSGEGIIAASINQESKYVAVYNAVVEFIKWYNEQKCNQWKAS